jgi:hypothetical protein
MTTSAVFGFTISSDAGGLVAGVNEVGGGDEDKGEIISPWSFPFDSGKISNAF